MNDLEHDLRRYAGAVVGPPRGPIPDEPGPGGAARLALVACIVLFLIVAAGSVVLARSGQRQPAQGDSGTSDTTSVSPDTALPGNALPSQDTIRQWVAETNAELGIEFEGPCPPPQSEDYAPPDTPLLVMVGGSPCRIMYYIFRDTSLPAVAIDGDGVTHDEQEFAPLQASP